MRLSALAILTASLAGSSSLALAQVADRYGGVNYYPAPATQQQPQRVLTWQGKTLPAPPPPQAAARGQSGRPTYGAYLQPPPYAQDRNAPPAPYAYQRNLTMYPPQAYGPPAAAYNPYAAQPQPTPQQMQQMQQQPIAMPMPMQAAPQQQPAQPYMPGPAQQGAGRLAPTPEQMAAAMPPPYSVQRGVGQAGAPSAFYPVQPGYPGAGLPTTANPPMAFQPTPMPMPQAMVPAQPAAPPPPPPPPASIYAPAPQAEAPQAEGEPKPQLVAALSAAPGARRYSVHRAFGLQPDAAVASPAPDGGMVELTAPVASGKSGAGTGASGLRTLDDPITDEKND